MAAQDAVTALREAQERIGAAEAPPVAPSDERTALLKAASGPVVAPAERVLQYVQQALAAAEGAFCTSDAARARGSGDDASGAPQAARGVGGRCTQLDSSSRKGRSG